MLVQAWAGTGRAIVAVDPENVARRNLVFDPRFLVALTDLAGTVAADGRPLLVDVAGAGPYIGGGVAVASAGSAGEGLRLRVLPHATAGPGAGLHGWVLVGMVAGNPQPNVQVRFTRQDGAGLGPAASRSGVGAVAFTGTVGAGSDTFIEITSTNGAPFTVVEAYAGTVARVGTFSGSDQSSASAVYSWAGAIGRSVSVETLTAENETISVHRMVDDTVVPVRGYQGVRAVGASISDNDVPLGRGVIYQVTTGSGERYYSNLVIVQPSAPSFADPETWPILSNPVTGESARVVLVSWDSKTYRTEKTRVRVPGRRSPVVISDVEAAPESTVVVETRDQADRATLGRLLAKGDPVLLRAPCPDIEDAYLDIDSRTAERVVKAGRSERRQHTLSVVEIDPPDMDVRGMGDTLQDLHDATGTLADVASRWATLGDAASADLIGEAR